MSTRWKSHGGDTEQKKGVTFSRRHKMHRPNSKDEAKQEPAIGEELSRRGKSKVRDTGG